MCTAYGDFYWLRNYVLALKGRQVLCLLLVCVCLVGTAVASVCFAVVMDVCVAWALPH